MAQGPDPNRNFDTDREITRAELEQGGGLGDPKSSRLGLSSWAIVVLVVVLAVVLVTLMR
jgi:hypothetical protein